MLQSNEIIIRGCTAVQRQVVGVEMYLLGTKQTVCNHNMQSSIMYMSLYLLFESSYLHAGLSISQPPLCNMLILSCIISLLMVSVFFSFFSEDNFLLHTEKALRGFLLKINACDALLEPIPPGIC